MCVLGIISIFLPWVMYKGAFLKGTWFEFKFTTGVSLLDFDVIQRMYMEAESPLDEMSWLHHIVVLRTWKPITASRLCLLLLCHPIRVGSLKGDTCRKWAASHRILLGFNRQHNRDNQPLLQTLGVSEDGRLDKSI